MKPELSSEIIRQHLDYDPETGVFTRIKAREGRLVGIQAGSLTIAGYREIHLLAHRFLAHRLAWFWVHGRWPSTAHIDHINGQKDDNRIANLREATPMQNSQNAKRAKDNTSGFTGVYWHKPTSNWTAMIFRRGKCISLGYFKDIGDAVAARRAAVLEHYVKRGISE